MILKSLLSKFSQLNLVEQTSKLMVTQKCWVPQAVVARCMSLSVVREQAKEAKPTGLMEFFDIKKNWNAESIRHGRPWRLDELRLKSNTDLHKLWFVLSKERNMLLTMEEIYKEKRVPMPSHERIAKVDESMENLLQIVEERNVAYNLLETGETKLHLPYRRYNSIGYIQNYREREYLVPWFLNKSWKLKYHYKKIPYWSKFFNSLNRVRLRKERNKKVKRVRYLMSQVLKKHPEYKEDAEFMQEQFEKKVGYTKPMPYHELIRRPRPDEMPKRRGLERDDDF